MTKSPVNMVRLSSGVTVFRCSLHIIASTKTYDDIVSAHYSPVVVLVGDNVDVVVTVGDSVDVVVTVGDNVDVRVTLGVNDGLTVDERVRVIDPETVAAEWVKPNQSTATVAKIQQSHLMYEVAVPSLW